VFTETEKALLQPLPDVPVEIGLWAKVKVQSNGHVQFEKAYYSVPFDLVQQELLGIHPVVQPPKEVSRHRVPKGSGWFHPPPSQTS